jgi:hypothetical protein
MTGAIVLPGAPSAALEAATKGYVDTADALKVNKAGDTMTGKLNMAAAGIGFSDTSTQTTAGVAKTGDTMTGLLVLSGAPVATLGAATKGYVDTAVATAGPIKAWANFNMKPLTGTYARSGTTITVTITAHGLSTGMPASLTFTTGTATSGSYVVNVTGVNTFTVTDTASGTTSGNVTMNMYVRKSYGISGIFDTAVGKVTVNFTSPMPDENYCVVASANFDNTATAGNGIIAAPIALTTTGMQLVITDPTGNTLSDAFSVYFTVIG